MQADTRFSLFPLSAYNNHLVQFGIFRAEKPQKEGIAGLHKAAPVGSVLESKIGGAGAGLLRSVGMGAGKLFHFWMIMQGVFGTVCAGFGAALSGYIG